MRAPPNERGGAGGRHPLSTAGPQQHSNDREQSQQPWSVVVCTREAVWGRYATQLEAQQNVCQLRARGFTAWVEADQ